MVVKTTGDINKQDRTHYIMEMRFWKYFRAERTHSAGTYTDIQGFLRYEKRGVFRLQFSVNIHNADGNILLRQLKVKN